MKNWAKSVAGSVRRTAGAALRASQRMQESVSLQQQGPDELDTRDEEELPVVARMMVEIRSDGRKTVARGALEDVVTGQRTTVHARGDSPVQLAASLASTLLKGPLLLGKVAGMALRNRELGPLSKPGRKP